MNDDPRAGRAVRRRRADPRRDPGVRDPSGRLCRLPGRGGRHAKCHRAAVPLRGRRPARVAALLRAGRHHRDRPGARRPDAARQRRPAAPAQAEPAAVPGRSGLGGARARLRRLGTAEPRRRPAGQRAAGPDRAAARRAATSARSRRRAQGAAPGPSSSPRTATRRSSWRDGMPALPDDQVYELWTITGHTGAGRHVHRQRQLRLGGHAPDGRPLGRRDRRDGRAGGRVRPADDRRRSWRCRSASGHAVARRRPRRPRTPGPAWARRPDPARRVRPRPRLAPGSAQMSLDCRERATEAFRDGLQRVVGVRRPHPQHVVVLHGLAVSPGTRRTSRCPRDPP